MTESEVRNVVREVLQDEREHRTASMDDTVLRTVAAILTTFGIDEDDRKEIQQDMRHLRKWRKSVETIERTGWVTAVTIIVTGILGALWLGFKTLLGK